MVAFIILSLLFLMFIGVPIGISMLLVAITYFVIEGIPLQIIIQQTFSGADSFVLTAIPLFMFAGSIMNSGGITSRILAFSNFLVGRVKGGLAQVNILASIIFAGMSGCAVTDTASLGSILIPAMKKEGYTGPYSAAVTAASSVVGPIIPPSVPMIVTAAIAGVSVAKLFIGAIIPGILYGLALMIIAYILAQKTDAPRRDPMPLREGWKTFKESIWGLLAPVIIVGGILSGIFTPTEAAGVAVVYSIFVTLVIYKDATMKDFLQMSYQAVLSTGTVMFVVAMAAVYSYILTREHIAEAVVNFLFGLSTEVVVLQLVLVGAALLIGCFLSTTPAIMLFIPVVAPLVSGVPGIDPIHFYILITTTLCVGTITPPVGISLYLAADLAESSVEKVLVALLPFFVAIIAVIILAILFPQLITYLPTKFMS